MDEDEHEDLVGRVEAANEELLGAFTNVLILERKVGKRKAHAYAEVLRFFGNDYLLDYTECGLLEGLDSFPSFVGDWFIRKCMSSDRIGVKKSVEAFRMFLSVAEGWGKITGEELAGWTELLEKNQELWCMRADCYNSPEVGMENLFDEDGRWNDEMVRAMSEPSAPVIIPGTGKLALNLLLSAKVAKFIGLKPLDLMKVKGKEDWEESGHPWFSNWRCEEAFGMKGTKDKVILVTNEQTRYSVLIRVSGKDSQKFLMAVHSAIMRAFDRVGVPRPTKVELMIRTLSGAARSLSSFQNQLMYHLDALLDRGEFEFLDDLERPLNHVPTKINGEYEFSDQVFAKMCEEDPPFATAAGVDVIVPFLN
ncbi:MAG: DUF6933 domain-containing protein [Luteolibacter sp.]